MTVSPTATAAWFLAVDEAVTLMAPPSLSPLKQLLRYRGVPAEWQSRPRLLVPLDVLEPLQLVGRQVLAHACCGLCALRSRASGSALGAQRALGQRVEAALRATQCPANLRCALRPPAFGLSSSLSAMAIYVLF